MAARGKRRKLTLLEQLAGVADPTPTDLDPEQFEAPDANPVASQSDAVGYGSSDQEDDEVSLAPSKLRAALPLSVASHPKYQGVAVSRDSAGFSEDDHIDSDDSDDGGGSGDSDGGGSTEEEGEEEDDVEEGSEDDESEDDYAAPGLSSTDEDTARIKAEFAELEEAERAAVTQLAKDPATDMKKGEHVKTQLSLWDALVETRIRLQPALALANRLPRAGQFSALTATHTKALAAARQACETVVTDMLGLQSALLNQNTATVGLSRGSGKRPRGDDSDAEEEEGSADGDGEGEGELFGAARLQHEALTGFTRETIEKWFTKTNLARNKTNTKQFKALDLSAMKQVDQVMADRGRLLKRTQLVRGELNVIGEKTPQPDAGSEEVASDSTVQRYNSEVFDDGDFYQEVLRDLIERKAAAADANDPIAMGRHWVELSKLRKKVKRKVDTKASKGRKLRYAVHDKLVSFLAPDPTAHSSTDKAKDDLFASLFQMV